MANTTQQPYKRRGSKIPTFVLLNPEEKKALQKLAVDTERSVGYYVRLAVVKFLVEAGLIEKPKTAGKIAARVVLVLLALSLTSVSLHAQTKAHPISAKQKSSTPAKIGDSYAKLALLALKAISADNHTPEQTGGGLGVAGNTQEKIDAADVEAQTQGEQTVTAGLRAAFVQKLTNNLNVELRRIALEGEQKTTLSDSFRDLLVQQAMEKDPEVLAIKKSEAACFATFEASLRARSASVPACEQQ